MNDPHLYMDIYGHYFRRFNGFVDFMGEEYTEELNHLDSTAVLLLVGKYITWDSNELHKEFILSANTIAKKNPKMKFFMKMYKNVIEDRKGVGFGKMYTDKIMTREEEDMYTSIVRYLQVLHSENQRFYRETKNYFFVPDFRNLENKRCFMKKIFYSIITIIVGVMTYFLYKLYKSQNYTISINIKSTFCDNNNNVIQSKQKNQTALSQNDIKSQQQQQQQLLKKIKNKKKRKQITRIISSQGLKPTEVKVIDRKSVELEDVLLTTDKEINVFIIILYYL